MKHLVTGGTGFTGKALVTRLVKEGHRVIALDYKEGLKTQEIREIGAEVMIGSVTDRKAVERCMKGVDVVHHLAAAFREMNVPEKHYWEVNVQGTRNVLEAAFDQGVKKFIYTSTCGVHGNVEEPPAGEDAAIAPADYYQRTKYEAEPIVNEYFHKGMKTVILRPAAIYGPGDPERFYLIFKRVAKGTFPMFGSGATYYHPLYIDNLIDAILLAAENERGDGRTYLIADENYISIRDLVEKVGAAMGIKVRIRQFPLTPLVVAGHVCETLCKPFGVMPPIFPRRVDWYRQNRAFRIDRARQELGYLPRIGLEEGLKRTAEFYRNEGLL